ncbi:hypothetical protein F5Y17DRAFT_352276 [Xylariaceae sp. FL0594]|nr:hypothetical protein F5Y17DRAFT_352276 [Xylariaceae sp. FL0594]
MRRTLLLAPFLRVASAVLVANGSPCETNCGNVLTSTAPDEVVCNDADYTGTPAGKVFRSCVTCEATSTYTTGQSPGPMADLDAMLYNIRYTTAQCLYIEATTICSTSRACGIIQNALLYNNLSSMVSTYGYCDKWTTFDLQKCTNCLEVSGQNVLRNFVSILSGACDLRIQAPLKIPLTGDPFSKSLVNVTNPTDIPTNHPTNYVGPLSYGALAAVVIGGIVGVLILAGCGVVLNGKRRRRAYLRRRDEQARNWPSAPPMGGEMYETPTSTAPLRGGGWTDSPISAATDSAYPAYPRYFSPYNSQYSSPVTAADGQGHPAAWPPTEKAQSIGMAISPDHDGQDMYWGDRKGKERAEEDNMDSYEMHEGVNSAGGAAGHSMAPPPSIYHQAPVLSHPGYGRNGHMQERSL